MKKENSENRLKKQNKCKINKCRITSLLLKVQICGPVLKFNPE